MELTEAETEYKVTCTKHIFKENVVFQFKCTNTIQEQVLEDVSVVMEVIEGESVFEEIATVPLHSMPLGKPGSTFVSFARAEVYCTNVHTLFFPRRVVFSFSFSFFF